MIFTISILDGIKYINLSFRITFGKLITPVIRLIQKSKEIEMKTLFIVTLLIAGMLTTYTQACTRVVYLGKNGMIVTGRTMDWKEDLKSNIYVFPRGIERAGADKGNTIHWKSKYGSVITAGYDIGTSDGMNEKGLVANLLYLTESDYYRPNDTRPVMGISIWTQYVLDNFATVDEAVKELSKETFRIDAPDMPNGAKSTLHLAISDASGNSAIFEYIKGKLIIHEGKEYQVMTNSPSYEQQITLNNYWQQIGGLVMLPGTNRAADRFVRASFYINVIPQTDNQREAVAGVFSVIRNVSVPLGISTPAQPNISSTRWRTVADQKNKVYFFESTMTPNVFWINMKDLDFSEGASVKKLNLANGETYAGNAAKDMVNSPSFKFLFEVI
jgi:penicillin V acylase-like amidase (Ntn superfamily)